MGLLRGAAWVSRERSYANLRISAHEAYRSRSISARAIASAELSLIWNLLNRRGFKRYEDRLTRPTMRGGTSQNREALVAT